MSLSLVIGVSHEMALEGAFTRLQRKFGSALDYYWHWTPECGISNGSTITNATVNPEVDVWTYGYHPPRGTVPMGSGRASTGYAEMWGGNAHCNTQPKSVCKKTQVLKAHNTS